MSDLVVEQAASPAQWTEVGVLIREYLAELPFEIDFQDLDRELAELPIEYGPPLGAALVARDGEGGAALGVVGVRRFGEDEAELKRMYVRPTARGRGAGGALAAAAVEVARLLGYSRLLLDTVATMTTAIATYESLGFGEIESYRHNPLPDARYFALDL